MVFKVIIAIISSFSFGLAMGILIIYFLAARKFFMFMKVERQNFCSEMRSNTDEIHGDVNARAFAEQKQKLLDQKEEDLDGVGK